MMNYDPLKLLSPRERAWSDIITTSLYNYDAKNLRGLVEQGIAELPPSQAYISGFHNYMDRQLERHQPMFPSLSNYGFYSSNQKIIDDLRDQMLLHIDLIKAHKLSVMDLHGASPYSLGFFLSQDASDESLIAAVENSSSDEIRLWLSQTVDGSCSNAKLDNSSSVIGVLVSFSKKEILSAITKKVPDWGNIVDDRKRNSAFYVRKPEMFQDVVMAGANLDALDKSGRNLSVWLAQATSAIEYPKLLLAISSLSETPSSVSADAAMVAKLFHLGILAFDDKEKAQFDLAVKNAEWTWQGEIEGVSRSWTLEEIWRFGEVFIACAQGVVMVPKGNNSFSAWPTDYRCTPGKLAEVLDQSRSLLPNDVQISWFSHDPDPLVNPFLSVLNWLATTTPRTEPVPSRPGTSSNTYSTAHLALILPKYTSQLFSKLSPAQNIEFVSGFEPLMNCRWLVEGSGIFLWTPIFETMAGNLSKSVPIAQSAWCNIFENSPVKSLWHHRPVIEALISALAAAGKDQKELSGSSVLTSLKTLSVMSKLGLTQTGSVSSLPSNINTVTQNAINMIEAGALDHVDVPSRFLSGLAPELKSIASMALLKKKVVDHKADARADLQSRPAPKM